MATYKILFWQEIPSQIKAEDDMDDVEEKGREGSAGNVAEAVKAELEAKADW